MSMTRTAGQIICNECGSDRAGYVCGSCQELVCCHNDCPAIAEEMERERCEHEQAEFEERQWQERQDFYGY